MNKIKLSVPFADRPFCTPTESHHSHFLWVFDPTKIGLPSGYGGLALYLRPKNALIVQIYSDFSLVTYRGNRARKVAYQLRLKDPAGQDIARTMRIEHHRRAAEFGDFTAYENLSCRISLSHRLYLRCRKKGLTNSAREHRRRLQRFGDQLAEVRWQQPRSYPLPR